MLESKRYSHTSTQNDFIDFVTKINDFIRPF